MNGPRLVVAGGAHIDRRGRVAGEHVPGASNPGIMREEVGGAAFNAARAAAQRRVSVSLVSLRGGDAAGEQVERVVEQAGFDDFSAIFLDRATPSYTAILTGTGELITGLADMALYEHGFAKQLRRRKVREAAASANAVLCDANMPADASAQLAALAEGKPVYAIAVSPAKAGRLTPIIPVLSCLFMNQREACRLSELPDGTPPSDAARVLRDMGLASGVITAGSSPALCFHGEEMFEISPPPVRRPKDVTGAGDALAGAAAAAMIRGLGFAEAARQGMAAAKLAVESETAAPDLSDQRFQAALDTVPQARSMY